MTHEELHWPQRIATNEELDAVFAEVASQCCAEGNHLFCQPGCTGRES